MQYINSKLIASTAVLAVMAAFAGAQSHDRGGSPTGGSSHSGSGGSSSGSWHSYHPGPVTTHVGSSSGSSYHTGSTGSYGGYGSRGGSGSGSYGSRGTSYGSRGGDFAGTNHNLATQSTVAGGHPAIDPVRVDRAPGVVFHGAGGGPAPAFEHGGFYRGGWRNGYYHYNHFFHDDHFFFGFYVFDPFAFGVCVCSPWYYYPCLPPYLAYSHVVFVDTWWPIYVSDAGAAPVVDSAPAENSPALDGALHDMVSAFQDDDRRALSNLCPRDGKVNIFTEGNYSYSLSADDFFDMYKDGVENVHTDKYVIEDVRINDKGDAQVKARHDYMDPWSKPQTVYHTYYLAHEGNGYVIREFGTSYYDK